MLQEERASLSRLALDKARFLTERLTQVKSDMSVTTDFATKLFQNQLANTSIPIHSALTSFGQSPPPNRDNTSSWFLPGSTTFDSAVLTNLPMIKLSSNLDFVYQPVHNASSSYIEVYMGFEASGLFRNFPWSLKNSFPNRPAYVCARTGAQVTVYDPRCRGWYHSAMLNKSFIFTPPYSDATTGNLLVTAAQPVYNLTQSLVGVVGFDLSIDTLRQNIVNTKIMENGYGYALDFNGAAVFHPNLQLDGDPPKLISLEFPNGGPEAAAFQTIVSKMAQLQSGLDQFSRNGLVWLIAYEPVPVAGYSIALVVPLSDVLAPSDSVEDDISNSLVITIVVFAVIAIVLIVAVWFFTDFFAARIVQPVTQLTSVCRNIVQNRLDVRVRTVDTSYEVALLRKTFTQLVTALRVGNEAYYGQNLVKAIRSYQQALDLFARLENERGVGVCLSNLGTLYMEDDQLQMADVFYTRAIEQSQRAIETATQGKLDPVKLVSLRNTLASRMSNLAILKGKQNDLVAKQQLLMDALEIDRETNNPVAFGIHSNNLGVLYMDTKRPDEAMKASQEAYRLASDPAALDFTHFSETDLEVTKQYSLMNMGNIMRDIHEPESALHYYARALHCSPFIDPKVEKYCFSQIRIMYEAIGDRKSMDATDMWSEPKEILLCLDYSGSMAGYRINQTVTNLLSIFDNQCRANDSVGLVKFSDAVSTEFNLTRKQDAYHAMRQQIASLVKPTGRTALYDALISCFDIIDQSANNDREQWLIVLTDGDDTSSQRANADSVRARLKSSTVNGLVFVAIGRDLTVRPYLAELAHLAEKGALVNCTESGRNAIDAAFSKVVEALSGQVVLDQY
jgi:Mg-chelatase subunit ChlD/uncharacterized protein YggT (Ycf19 family)